MADARRVRPRARCAGASVWGGLQFRAEARTMTMEPAPSSEQDKIAALRAIDTDVHNDLPSYAELKPFLASQWHAWLDDGGPGFAQRAYANTGSGVMDDAVREEDD